MTWFDYVFVFFVFGLVLITVISWIYFIKDLFNRKDLHSFKDLFRRKY